MEEQQRAGGGEEEEEEVTQDVAAPQESSIYHDSAGPNTEDDRLARKEYGERVSERFSGCSGIPASLQGQPLLVTPMYVACMKAFHWELDISQLDAASVTAARAENAGVEVCSCSVLSLHEANSFVGSRRSRQISPPQASTRYRERRAE